MPISGQERSAYHGVCTSTKRPYQGQNKSSVKSDKAAVDFFSLAAVVGIPFYLVMRKPIGSSIAAILMVTIMLPFFFMAMYEKDGLPFEKVVANIIRQKFICPAVRPYKTENFYQEISTLVKKEGVPDGKKTKQEAQQERLSLAEKRNRQERRNKKAEKKENRKSVERSRNGIVGNRKTFLQLHSRVFRIFECCRMVSAR